MGLIGVCDGSRVIVRHRPSHVISVILGHWVVLGGVLNVFAMEDTIQLLLLLGASTPMAASIYLPCGLGLDVGGYLECEWGFACLLLIGDVVHLLLLAILVLAILLLAPNPWLVGYIFSLALHYISNFLKCSSFNPVYFSKSRYNYWRVPGGP